MDREPKEDQLYHNYKKPEQSNRDVKTVCANKSEVSRKKCAGFPSGAAMDKIGKFIHF